MELKDYQKTTLEIIKNNLEKLDEWKKKAEAQPDFEIDFPTKAWEKLGVKDNYIPRKNGLGEELPNFCLKIPTGGGKTFLAVKTIDLVNQIYLKRRNGLVLWIVPTTQIYRQTLQNLKNRDHPYRQHLDIASGGKTMILERNDHFTPIDLEENLVVLMLMLPAANRQTKETLRMFKDSGNFMEFFPLEDDIDKNEELLGLISNLDTYGDENGFWKKQIKTSLGNVLKIQKPLIILDEGHKAYSEQAQKTLRDFNPSMIVELSATPPDQANELVEIFGTDLHRADMIKLDLHITNKTSPDWKDTLRDSVNKQKVLEKIAVDYLQNTNNYIRPINVIQVERTGKDQIGGSKIHSEEVRDFLIKGLGIEPQQIAIKTSEKDELKEVDNIGGLMSKDCSIRFIITKQALQEGWDCAFAYILTILTNPGSKNALTQLVGRILRQPYARKTRVRELDESYVFCFKQRADALLSEIRKGFGEEGLGDLAGQIVADEIEEGLAIDLQPRIFEVQDKFQEAVKDVFLPVFVTKDRSDWRKVNYDTDIASKIDWNNANINPIFDLALLKFDDKDYEHIAGLSDDINMLVEQRKALRLRTGGFELDSVFFTRQLLDIVSNPWVAFEMAQKTLNGLIAKNSSALVKSNFVFIIETLIKLLEKEKDRLAKKIFDRMISKKEIRFLIISKGGFNLPPSIEVKGKRLRNKVGDPLQRSLFEAYPEIQFNDVEKSVAWYLDDQSKLFFWYRNAPKSDYFIQGWKNQKVYPDFIFAQSVDDKLANKVYILETKGLHLLGSQDTKYKKDLFGLCNQLAKEKNWNELGLTFKDKEIQYEVVSEKEWQAKINEMLV